MNWTRKDDALIAEWCEGLRTAIVYPHGAVLVHDNGTFGIIDEYNTDPSARERAAEAWRLQKPGRSYAIYSARGGDCLRPASAELTDVHDDGSLCMPIVASTLHEALLAWAKSKEGK